MFWSLIAGAMNSQRARAHLLGASRRIIGLWEVGGKGGRPCVYVTSGNSSTYTLPCARNNSSSILRWLGNRDKEAKEERLFGERGWAVPKLHASSSDRTRSLDKIHFWRQDLHHYNPLVPLGIRHSDVSNTSLLFTTWKYFALFKLKWDKFYSSWSRLSWLSGATLPPWYRFSECGQLDGYTRCRSLSIVSSLVGVVVADSGKKNETTPLESEI